MEHKHTPRPAFISHRQVAELNAKYGWFEFADGQSDVSNAFANEAIERYERTRSAASDLLEALQFLLEVPQLQGEQADSTQAFIERARAAIAKATGTQP